MHAIILRAFYMSEPSGLLLSDKPWALFEVDERPTRTVAGLYGLNRGVTVPAQITLDDRPDDVPAASGICARFP